MLKVQKMCTIIVNILLIFNFKMKYICDKTQ